ncbi:MAG: hypothetical protein ACFFF4_17765 [Candidatus Thorarchaeota archaeon]
MIDDDFDKLVRNMFERFFGKSFDMFPNESGIQMRIGSENNTIPETNPTREVVVDSIDLGDEYLVIIESPITVESPIASIKNNTLEVRFSEVVSKGVELEVPFNVDIAKSSVSQTNGVIEVRLVKANDESSDQTEGILRVI